MFVTLEVFHEPMGWLNDDGVLTLYTRTCPAADPVASLRYAPIATLEPSAERLTEYPLLSLAASPSISAPS